MKRIDIYFLLLGLFVIFVGVIKANQVVPVIGLCIFILGLIGLRLHLKKKEHGIDD